jgi:regulatory protein
VRIESVRYDASGDATIVASGGIIFFLPRGRIKEFASVAATRLGLSLDTEEPDAAKTLVDALIADGIDFDPEDRLMQCLACIDQEWKAEKKGLELCARAEQSSQGLKAKLVARGFESAAAAEAVRSLIKAGTVDDVRFASIWARTRAEGKCEGPSLIAAGLRARGLGLETIKTALSAVDFDSLIPRAIEKEARRLSRRAGDNAGSGRALLKEKIYNSLKVQGFSASLLRDELEL